MPLPPYEVVLLADAPDLALPWAELHWREWGSEPGREVLEWWVADAARATERARPPLALIARAHDGQVLGGLGLHVSDLEERRGDSPWVVGVIVRPEWRGEGIGQALLAALEHLAARAEIPRLWVATETGSRAVEFYLRCGFTRVEEIMSPRRGLVTVLIKSLVGA